MEPTHVCKLRPAVNPSSHAQPSKPSHGLRGYAEYLLGLACAPSGYATATLAPSKGRLMRKPLRNKIRGQSSTTCGGPHFCAHPHTEREQTSPSRVDQRRPIPTRTRASGARRRQLPTGLHFCRARRTGRGPSFSSRNAAACNRSRKAATGTKLPTPALLPRMQPHTTASSYA
jgi:hypothetical protein